MTASGLRRNMGAAPSHTAHALIPLFQKPLTSPEPGKSSRRATAPAHKTPNSGTSHRPWHLSGHRRCIAQVRKAFTLESRAPRLGEAAAAPPACAPQHTHSTAGTATANTLWFIASLSETAERAGPLARACPV